MDRSRGSSIYSNDSSRKPTYLDYRSSVDTGSRPGSVRAARDYVESLSSAPSRAPPPAPSISSSPPPAPSISSSSSRPSSRPSYMNYQNGSPKSSRRIDLPEVQTGASNAATAGTQVSAPRHQGTLLVLIVAEVHPQTMHFLSTWLKRWPFTAISVVGAQKYEAEIKQLKMEIYGLTGKLGREVSVHTHLQAEWNSREVGATLDMLHSASTPDRDVRGVLCCISYGNAGSVQSKVLGLAEAELEESWRQSVGCLHSVATAIIPRLRESDRPEGEMFLVLEPSEPSLAATLNKAACDALLSQLRIEYASERLTIDYAERVLLPEPELPELAGRIDGHQNGYAVDEMDFAASESPTKLWAMWQNEVGG
ncbi:hypothetical protein B0A55_04640 [Friedmanniomyces simplex]|uniref:Uncharacterized protein n=1 Tax=Friedmanniomyces simplex TaxID=329884 RepID=A0A4U0XKP5_9PEZI|nr:hypothetical protein B0A55_04640 [Friedmanniomyces simplex]